jgi:RNA polymerase sigma-70 factor (ECF subfamily)
MTKANGDRFFDDVYSPHVTFIWRTLRAMGLPESVVEDAAQDVFIVAHRKLADFDGQYAIKTWLFHIAYRVACEYRRKGRRSAAQQELDDTLQDAGPSPSDSLERREAVSLLRELLAQVDEEKRDVLILAEIEEMTAPEIAVVTGTPVNTVYTRLRRGRSQLSQALLASKWRPR